MNVDTLEASLRANSGRVVIALIALLFAYNLYRAAAVHLNPDEALHYQLAYQHSFLEAYAANNTNAHPPLFILTLYFWTKLGASEVFLRLLSILSYCGFLWFLYRWAGLVAGAEAALAATVIAAFSPPAFNLASEVRHYMPLLCWIAATLWAMERAFRLRTVPERCWNWMAAGTGFLYLAILTDYSGLWFVAAFGICCLVRLRLQALPARAAVIWAAGQAGAIGIYLWLYTTHISVIRDSAMAREAREGWLRHAYRLAGDNPVGYLFANTHELFQYLFGIKWALLLGVGLFLSGVFLLRRKRMLLGILLTPWMLYAAASLLGLFPYGAVRQAVFLTPFFATAAGVALATASNRKFWILSALLLVLVPLWHAAALPDAQVLPAREQKRELITDAVRYLRESAPPGGLVFTDYQSALLLCYYDDPNKYCLNDASTHFWQYDLGEIRVVTPQIWDLNPDQFAQELKRLKRHHHLNPAAVIWTLDAGWGIPIHRALQSEGTALPELRTFGEHIAVFRNPTDSP